MPPVSAVVGRKEKVSRRCELRHRISCKQSLRRKGLGFADIDCNADGVQAAAQVLKCGEKFWFGHQHAGLPADEDVIQWHEGRKRNAGGAAPARAQGAERRQKDKAEQQRAKRVALLHASRGRNNSNSWGV